MESRYIRQGNKTRWFRPDYGETYAQDYCLDAPELIPTGNQAEKLRLTPREQP